MKIAFDLDDTYLKDRKLFNHLYDKFKNAGHHVGIISCRAQRGCDLNFEPDFEFYGNLAGPIIQPQIEYKTRIMEENNIDILFDDMAEFYPSGIVVIRII